MCCECSTQKPHHYQIMVYRRISLYVYVPTLVIQCLYTSILKIPECSWDFEPHEVIYSRVIWVEKKSITSCSSSKIIQLKIYSQSLKMIQIFSDWASSWHINLRKICNNCNLIPNLKFECLIWDLVDCYWFFFNDIQGNRYKTSK